MKSTNSTQICLALVVVIFGGVQCALTKCSNLSMYSGWYERVGTGKCYFVSTGDDQAVANHFGAGSIRDECRLKDADAYPVAVNTWSEFSWLRAHLSERGLTATRWTGGKYIFDPDTSSSNWGWKWIYAPGTNTGVSLSSTRWCSSASSDIDAIGQCVVTTYCSSATTTNKIRFSDRSCTSQYRYICEIEKGKLGLPITWALPGK